MNLKNFRFERGEDGIAILTWDMVDRSMNVINVEVMDEIESVIASVASDAAIKGCVFTSGKETFSAGADLAMLQGSGHQFAQIAEAQGEEKAMQVFFAQVSRLSLLFRKLETSGKPWVAAIHGTCMGGAFEMALACHHRIVSDSDKTRVGLPEIKVGLFPGGGGTQRVARLMPTGDALQMLFKGEQIRPKAAMTMGLVHQVVAREALLETAKAWILGGGKPVAPWDEKGFKPPSGKVFSPTGMMTWPPANAIYRRETHDNYPAAKAILVAVYEGLQLPMDLALRVEARQFAKILRSKEAAAMIRSLFLSMGELNKGARRPPGVPETTLRKVGVLGAGFMGAGIAYVSANAGLEVVLIDRDQASADNGKAYSHKLVSEQINKGRAKAADRDALLARIHATHDYAALADCDLVVEAVFEDRGVKAEATRRVAEVIGQDIVYASNTSTLPITSLAETFARPADFVGIHFFSPVEKMMLVEIIRGEKTSDRAVAAALDFVRIIKKTPIVVNDARGFFANRCVGNYIREGHLMLMEGVPPAMIENLAKMAGMPVGPLSLNDEVAVDLAWKILQAAEKDDLPVDAKQKELLEAMVVRFGRLGRKNRKGFYDYPENGKKKLWPGLADIPSVALDPDTIDKQDIKDRLLVVQALEAARTVEDGVITDMREADVGSILGFGFAPFTGGTLSFIDGMGTKVFVALCRKLAERHGARFEPNRLLVDMGEKNETFYVRFAGTQSSKQAA